VGATVAGASVGAMVLVGVEVGRVVSVGLLVCVGRDVEVGRSVDSGRRVSSGRCEGREVWVGLPSSFSSSSGSSVSTGVGDGEPLTGVGVGEASEIEGGGVMLSSGISPELLNKLSEIKKAIKNINIKPTIVPITAKILFPFACSFLAL